MAKPVNIAIRAVLGFLIVVVVGFWFPTAAVAIGLTTFFGACIFILVYVFVSLFNNII